MPDIALQSFVNQIDTFSFRDKLSILDAVIRSLGRGKKSADASVSKAESLYGLIKDSPLSLETAREERLTAL